VLDEICSVPPPLHTLKIWERGSTPGGATGPSLSVFLSVFLSVTLLLGQLYTATSRVNIDVRITWAWL